ncbi:cytochrome P450 3A24-like [Dreissena polymorpha]|uniref:Cytochrome P450 n=1 Tax=Dreissena polymorpha TaxID=45954 RepID=A0A9D4C962_DREPO|nr:cytochrome P450 3A24-like [Dreissena polymorpha]KAH3719545.1 hypothetical protein DPMN_062382 [Dreissena polymorpha]
MYSFIATQLVWWTGGAITVLSMVALALYAFTTYKHGYFRRRGIKGPKPSPFWGHIKDLMAVGAHEFDRRSVKEFGQVYGFYFGNHPTLMVADPDILKEIAIKQFSNFYNRGDTVQIAKVWQNSVNNAKGIKWKYLRAILQPAFSSGKIKGMRPILKRCLDDMISCLDSDLLDSKEHVVEMNDKFKRLTMDVICSSAFGIEVNTQRNPEDQFVKHASKILGGSLSNKVLLLNWFFPDFQSLIMYFAKDFNDPAAMEFLGATVRKAMEERKKSYPHEYRDILQLMMNTKSEDHAIGVSEEKSFEEMKKGGMSDADIIINGIIFLAAGHETTAALLGFISYNLATHPEVQERLLEEIDEVTGTIENSVTYESILKMEYLEMILQETLRLYPPAGRFNRQPAEDVTIKGVHFEKGMDITFTTYGIHMNPIYWPEPEKFDPERFSPANRGNIYPYSHVPFGAGPRNCVGMKLALAETKMAIVRLLQSFRLEPSDKLTIPLKTNNGGGLLRPVTLWLKLVRRKE